MKEIETTSMSSRGQVVIPSKVRERLGLHEGEKFIVMGDEDTVILKKIQPPSFDILLKKTMQFAKQKGITKNDLEESIKRARE